MAHTTSGSFPQRGFLGLCAGDRSWEVARFHPVSSGLVGMYVCARPMCMSVCTPSLHICTYSVYVRAVCVYNVCCIQCVQTYPTHCMRVYIECVHIVCMSVHVCTLCVYFCVHILCPYPSVR